MRLPGFPLTEHGMRVKAKREQWEVVGKVGKAKVYRVVAPHMPEITPADGMTLDVVRMIVRSELSKMLRSMLND